MNQMSRWASLAACVAALFVAGCAGGPDTRSTGEVIDDTAIHTKVKAALINDPIIQGTKMNVDVVRGMVYLDGAVNGEVAKQKAEEIARGVEGVRGVENNLIVRQAQ